MHNLGHRMLRLPEISINSNNNTALVNRRRRIN